MSDDLKIKVVMKFLDQDLTVEKATASVVDLLDSVVGSLQNGYQVQSQEIQENDEDIKALGEELFGMFNALV